MFHRLLYVYDQRRNGTLYIISASTAKFMVLLLNPFSLIHVQVFEHESPIEIIATFGYNINCSFLHTLPTVIVLVVVVVVTKASTWQQPHWSCNRQSLYDATLFLSQRNTTFIGNCFWPKTAEEPKNETNTHALRLAEWLA